MAVYTTTLYQTTVADDGTVLEEPSTVELAAVGVEVYDAPSLYPESEEFELLSTVELTVVVYEYGSASIVDDLLPYESPNIAKSFMLPAPIELSPSIATMDTPPCSVMDFLGEQCINVSTHPYLADESNFISYSNSSEFPLPTEDADINHVSYGIMDAMIEEQIFIDPSTILPELSPITLGAEIPIMDAYKNEGQGFEYGSNNMFFWEGYIYQFTGLFAIISKRINRLIYPSTTLTVQDVKRRCRC